MTFNDVMFDSCPLTLNHDHDITTQATSGTRPTLRFDNPRYSFSSTYSTSEDASSYGSLMSASSSRTSLSSDSSDELPTRPSSPAGWEYEGAWSVGKVEAADEILWHNVQTKVVDTDDLHCDPAESSLTNSPFLIAQYVAQQLRADVLEDFPTTWPRSPEPQTPLRSTPKSPLWTPRPSSSQQQYTSLIAALGLASPVFTPRPPASTRFVHTQRHSAPANSPQVPTIMVTAPSSDPPSPVFRYNSVGYEMAANSLMIRWCARRRPSNGYMPVGNQPKECTDDEESDEEMSLSEVKKNLEASRPRYGLRGKVLALLKRRV